MSSEAAIAVADSIRAHADIFTKDGRKIVRYHDGWNDAKVAEDVEPELGFKPRVEAIIRLRQAAIGSLENTGGIFGTQGPFAKRLAEIEGALASQAETIATLTRIVNDLRGQRMTSVMESDQPDLQNGSHAQSYARG